MKTIILVCAEFNRRGKIALQSAFELAGRVNAPVSIIRPTTVSGAQLVRELHDLRCFDVYQPNFMLYADFESALRSPFATGREVIFVTSKTSLVAARLEVPDHVHILFSLEGFPRMEALRFCLPVGNRSSSRLAIGFALDFASMPKAGVVSGHTTYRDPSREGTRPDEHQSEAARRMHELVRERCAQAGVDLTQRFAIHAKSIPGYISQIANQERCWLTIMATGEALLNGNAELVVRTGNIPVLVVAKAYTASSVETMSSTSPSTPPPTVGEAPINAQTRWYLHPIAAEGASILQYTLKAALKIGIGVALASPMLTGDGFHNLADILQAAIIMASIWITKRERAGYPFKLRELENLITLALGFLVTFTGLHILSGASVGLLAQWQSANELVRSIITLPTYTPVRVESRLLVPLAGLMAFSVALSLATSAYQIHVGRLAREAALVADGEETRMDAKVEFLTLIGILLVQGLGWRAAEYCIAFVIAGFVLHTGYEILLPAWRSTLKKSLDHTLEEQLRAETLAIAGVREVRELVTYPIGRSMGVISIAVESHLEAARHPAVRAEIERLANTLFGTIDGIRDLRVEIEIRPPQEPARRLAYGCLLRDGQYVVASHHDEVTHLVICDLLNEDPAESRIRPYPVEGELSSFLVEKYVDELFLRENTANGTLPCTVRLAISSIPEECLGIHFSRS